MANNDSVPDQNHGVSTMLLIPWATETDHSHDKYSAHNLSSEGLAQSQTQNDEHDMGSQLEQQPAENAQNLEQNGDPMDDAGDDVLYDNVELDMSDDHNQLAIVQYDQEYDVDDDIQITLDQIVEQPMELAPPPPPVLLQRPVDPPPNLQLTVGQQFPDAKSCRRALREVAIALRFEIQTIKSDNDRFTVRCASEGCPWRIHAAKTPGAPTFTIRTIREPHTCAGLTHLGHTQASVQWVAESVEQQLRENPNFKPKEILEEIHRIHGITLSYKQAWRGKERIMASVRGSFEEEYRLLPRYCDQIKRSNPGSTALVYGDPVENCFQRLFIAFQASIYGFLNACQPLIELDCVPLKSKHPGTLLLAAGFDGDGGIYPVAFGVVNEEIDENWLWFISELHNLLETNAENMPRLTVLSSRKKGIIDGIDSYFPIAYHGYCMHCLSENFMKEFNNTLLKNILLEAANSLSPIDFETKILEIEEISLEAAEWIRKVPPTLWATAYFEGKRLGQLTANVGESLSTILAEASGLPIIQMMESLRRYLITMFDDRLKISMEWKSILVPYAERKVVEAIEQAHSYRVLRENEAEFQVLCNDSETNTVNIRTRFCSCSGWEIYGLPCSHAVAVLLSCRQNVHRFTESFFTVANYRKAYSQTIQPIPDKAMWNMMYENEGGGGDNAVAEVVINPPKSLNPPVQPRKKRASGKDSGGRGKRVVRCSRCDQTGHFRTTCSVPI